MSGLEIIAVVPFVIAAWRLTKKVYEQQNLIEQHEVTISTQQDALESLIHNGAGPNLSRSVGRARLLAVTASVVIAGGMAMRYTYQLSRLRRNVAPPASYEPVEASFDAEECVICMANRKDTLASPCQHFCMCWPCASRILGNECPVCRARIEFIQFAYMS